MLRILAVLGAAMMLVGCITVPPHSVSRDEVAQYRLVAVDAVFEPNASVNWRRVDEKVLEGSTLPRPALEQALVRARTEQLRARAVVAFTEPLSERLRGNRPVKVVVRVRGLGTAHTFDGLGQAIVLAVLVGPPPPPRSSLAADVDVVDAKTGQTLLTYRGAVTGGAEALAILTGSGEYSGDAAAGLLKNLARDFAEWVLPTR